MDDIDVILLQNFTGDIPQIKMNHHPEIINFVQKSTKNKTKIAVDKFPQELLKNDAFSEDLTKICNRWVQTAGVLNSDYQKKKFSSLQ